MASADDYLPAEARARVGIDRQLVACRWIVQDRKDLNLYAGEGVAVREFIMAPGHGRVDYLLFVGQKAVGAIEAKPSGTPLAGVESQSAKYSTGLSADLPALVDPLPFLYGSTGDETMFMTASTPTLGAARSSRSTVRRPWPAGCATGATTPTAGRSAHDSTSSARSHRTGCVASRSRRSTGSKHR